MARWPKIRDDDYGRLLDQIGDEVRRTTICGTLRAGDEPVAGQAGFVEVARDRGLSRSRVYPAVNTAIAQPWIIWKDGQPCSMQSSLEAWFVMGRHELARTHRDDLRSSFISWGRLGGRPRK